MTKKEKRRTAEKEKKTASTNDLTVYCQRRKEKEELKQ